MFSMNVVFCNVQYSAIKSCNSSQMIQFFLISDRPRHFSHPSKAPP